MDIFNRTFRVDNKYNNYEPYFYITVIKKYNRYDVITRYPKRNKVINVEDVCVDFQNNIIYITDYEDLLSLPYNWRISIEDNGNYNISSYDWAPLITEAQDGKLSYLQILLPVQFFMHLSEDV